MCQRSRCDVLRIFQAHTQFALTHARETRHLHYALIAGRRFLPRHINQLITYPTHTTHSHAPSRQYNCTMGNKNIYIMEIPQSQTKCNLYNSISGATDLITVHLVYTVLVFIGGPWGRHVPPPPI